MLLSLLTLDAFSVKFSGTSPKICQAIATIHEAQNNVNMCVKRIEIGQRNKCGIGRVRQIHPFFNFWQNIHWILQSKAFRRWRVLNKS